MASVTQRAAWAILIALTLYVCYFSNLGVIGFIGPDEPRYAWIARDMAETGDWVTPRLYGRPWFEKPPLLYWGGALFFKLTGEDHPEVAARLPSAISALLATLALAWLAWRTYGEECARWLLLLLPTSVGMIGFSHAAATDMPLAGMLTVAMVCAAVVLGLSRSDEDRPILPHTPWAALFLFGFFLGLAVLAKGPAALILCGGAVFFWAAFSKRWRDAVRLLHPAAIASFCFTALPWYILCARRNPDFLRIFVIEHNFKRYLTVEFQHIQPFWYYLPILLIAFLPWIVTLIWSLWIGLRTGDHHPLTLLLLSWSVFCIVFFSISRSKLPGYVLPAVPAIGLLLARSVQSLERPHARSFRACALAGAFLFAIAALAFCTIGRFTAPPSNLNGKAGTAYGLLALSFSLVNLLLILARSYVPRRKLPVPLIAAIPIVATVFFASYFVRSTFAHDPSAKTIAAEIRKSVVTSSDVYVGPISRGRRYGLNFYLRREIQEWDPTNPRIGILVLDKKNCKDVVAAPYVCGEADWQEGAGAFLYSITLNNSLSGLGGGGQSKQEK
jgi:4-amino-4-deoxy-L-arabinose transferase-like glycosyltransferase